MSFGARCLRLPHQKSEQVCTVVCDESPAAGAYRPGRAARATLRPMRIWIDLSNSPHPLLFKPISRRLEQAGHSVHITARDKAQTLELARARWDHVYCIGWPRAKGRKA